MTTDTKPTLETGHLKDIMSIPSCSGHEGALRARILAFAAERGIASRVDCKGNVYLTKGVLAPGESYPCLVNHMDTVQWRHGGLADAGRSLTLATKKDASGRTVLFSPGTGIGADDKLGCAIALAILAAREKAKAVFFVEEELGMLGSKAMDVSWFDDVSFCLSYDSPDRDRASHSCNGRVLYSPAFFRDILQPVCARHGVTRFNEEPFTDVAQIRDRTDIMCFNVGNGGHRAHCPDEYLVVEESVEACELGMDLLDQIGLRFADRMRNERTGGAG